MNWLRGFAGIALVFALAGCLEVQQYPKWINGEYAGKPASLPQQAHFFNDVLAWNAAIANRNQLQNEYVRMDPPGTGAD